MVAAIGFQVILVKKHFAFTPPNVLDEKKKKDKGLYVILNKEADTYLSLYLLTMC